MEVREQYYDADDVCKMLGIKRTKAYQIIRGVKEEAVKKGELSPFYPPGKIPKQLFRKSCMIEE